MSESVCFYRFQLDQIEVTFEAVIFDRGTCNHRKSMRDDVNQIVAVGKKFKFRLGSVDVGRVCLLCWG